ncbi:O-antigen ligase family protein [Fictibacillus nanhaiensis]|uniref:O-antigen ligase family protein n=1 Tax=Fictibacillus nanhaiensis TaxID=742169 RepID=UPI002E24A9AA|nr:O-antigen ligase family protein [Fictibacillus nanhaiensis]
MKNNVLNHQNSELKVIVLGLISAVLIGSATPFVGIYIIGAIVGVIALFLFLKIELNSKTAFLFVSLLLYVNVLRPFGGYKIISSGLDALLILLIVKHLFKNGVPKSKAFYLFCVTSFLLISFFQIFNDNIPSLEAGMQGFRKTSLAFILFYLGLLGFDSSDEVRKFVKKFSIISVPVLIFGIKQYFSISDLDRLFLEANNADIYTGMLFGKVRAVSIFAGSFHFGMFAAVLAILNMFLISTSRKLRGKFFYLILFSLSFMACYTSMTRTNLIALAVGILAYKILQMNLKVILMILPVVTIAMLSFFSYVSANYVNFLLSENSFIRMIGTIASFQEDTRLAGRSHGWETISHLIKEKPFIAYGTGSAGDTLQNLYEFQYHVTSHNFFLKILMETGVFGGFFIFVLFLSIFMILIRKTFNKPNNIHKKIASTSLAVFLIFLVNSLVGSTIETYPVSGFILLLLGIGISTYSDQTVQ